jgi:hypothetical protein
MVKFQRDDVRKLDAAGLPNLIHNISEIGFVVRVCQERCNMRVRSTSMEFTADALHGGTKGEPADFKVETRRRGGRN